MQAGADADLVVFDEARVTDQATYAASTRPSSGIAHVLVGGTFVVRDGELVPDALPGGRVRAADPATRRPPRRGMPCVAARYRMDVAPAPLCADQWFQPAINCTRVVQNLLAKCVEAVGGFQNGRQRDESPGSTGAGSSLTAARL